MAAAQMICRQSPDPSDDPIKIPLAVNKRRQTHGPADRLFKTI